MERRSFLRTISAVSARAVFPYASFGEGKWADFEQTDIEGIGIGISVCDTLSNGFFGGQVISVFGPESGINEAFLIHAFLYQIIAQRKRVDYICSTGSLKNWEQSYLRRLGFNETSEMRRELTQSGIIENLRIIEIDLYTQSWKDYVALVKDQPPDSIIIDDIEFIEEYFYEKAMVKQLKRLARDVNAPVFVIGPLNKKRSMNIITHPNLRNDFGKWTDVCISLVPKNVSAFIVNEIKVGKRYLVDLKLIAVSCPCARHKGYGGVFSVDFIDYDLRFTSI